jgi:hypothetical protein
VDVELREITSETVRTICDLAVEEHQRSFVAPNAVSMAEAHFEPKHWMRAIYADGEPAGSRSRSRGSTRCSRTSPPRASRTSRSRRTPTASAT